ncbi:MAG: aspartate--tRNA(Asn) ligase [Candidatus Heimdallarchaeota archaeon]|nr:aspartate--tRNA(Asn) ligase [Candidatus Heimdallarchaeota archaeon]
MDYKEMLTIREPTDKVTPDRNGEEIVVAGYLTNIRNKGKKLKFLELSDRAGDVQLTFKQDIAGEEMLDRINNMTIHSFVTVLGEVKETTLTKRGVEIMGKEIVEMTSPPKDTPFPVEVTDFSSSNLDTRLDNRYLDLRRRPNLVIFQLLSDFANLSREYFLKQGFMEIFSPKFVGAATEDGAEVFEVKYFNKTAYLAQSPQFYKQMAICSGFEKVFEIAPVFRSNPSHTSRHDTEFTSLDIEMGYISDVEDVMHFEESWFNYVFKKMRKKWNDTVKEIFDREIVIPKLPFPRISMPDAIKIVTERGVELEEPHDLGSAGERELGAYVMEKYKHQFVFLTEFSQVIRPFYHMRPEKGNTTLSFDLLFNGIEITTGAQREHRYDILIDQIKDKGGDPKEFEFYTDFFKYGAPPHGGFGLSPTRVIMLLLGLSNVREATFLPRDMDRLFP